MKKLTLLLTGAAIMAMLPSHTFASTNADPNPVIPFVPPGGGGPPPPPGDDPGVPPGGDPGGPGGGAPSPSNVNQGNSISIGDSKDMKDAKSLVYPVSEGYWSLFVLGTGGYDDVGKTADPSHFYAVSGGGAIGAEYHFPSDWAVGLSLGYNHTDANFTNSDGSATEDSYDPTLFASYNHEGWFANGNLTGGYDTYTQDFQGGTFGPGSVDVHGSTSGFHYGGGLSGGKLFQDGDWSFGPLAGVNFRRTFISGFTQTDAGFPGDTTSFTSSGNLSLTSYVGGVVRYQAQIGSVTVLPYLTLGWQHEYLDTTLKTQGTTHGAPPASVSGVSALLDRDSAVIHLGANAYVTDHVTVFVDYGNDVNATYVDQTVNGGVSYSF